MLTTCCRCCQAVQPDKLSLDADRDRPGPAGRGRELGQTLVDAQRLPAAAQPAAAAARHRHQAAGRAQPRPTPRPRRDPAAALNDFARRPARRSSTQRASFAALLANLTTASDDLRSFLRRQRAQHDQPVRRQPADACGSWPGTRRSSRARSRTWSKFVPEVNKVLGAGHRRARPARERDRRALAAAGTCPARTPPSTATTWPALLPVPFRGIHRRRHRLGTARSRDSCPHAAASASRFRELTGLGSASHPLGASLGQLADRAGVPRHGRDLRMSRA